MLKYLLTLILYTVFIILIVVIKKHGKPEVKKLIISIVTSIAALVAQFIVEMIIQIIVTVFVSDKSVYISSSLIINALDILIPFIVIYLIGALNGCKVRLGIVLAISLLFVILSFALKYIATVDYWEILVENARPEYLEEAGLTSLIETDEALKEAKSLTSAAMFVNFLPATLYGGCVLFMKEEPKRRRA